MASRASALTLWAAYIVGGSLVIGLSAGFLVAVSSGIKARRRQRIEEARAAADARRARSC